MQKHLLETRFIPQQLLGLFLVAICANLAAVPAIADESLHEAIDRLIAAKTPDYEKMAAPISSDAEFLRRVSLDLTGRIPTTEVTRQFLADADPQKRTKLIDRLLNSPEYARHMQNVFDVLLMRRLPTKHVSTAEWQTFLRKSFAENKPWDQIVREILSADGTDPKNRGPARFYLDRNGEVNEITRDIGRVFLGANLECAQCHDHPEVDDYKIDHYYGISAYLVRSFVFTDPKKKVKPVFAEKGEGEVKFKSVFNKAKDAKERTTLPKVFDVVLTKEPTFKKGEEYTVKPAKGVRPIPKFSRRSQLAVAVTGPNNKRFPRTAANRLWAVMMGRGLVHPIDFDHSDNPPSHPELLDRLTSEFVGHKFDIKWFLRELVLSKTYQRSSQRLVDGQQVPPADETLFAQAILKPLQPAQFAWTVLQATGEADIQRKALGDKLNETVLHQKLVSYENKFIQLFGGLPGQPPESFESTANQVLFLSNDGMIQKLIRTRAASLTGRLLALPENESQKIAQELFLSTLTRQPTEQDVQDVTEYLTGQTGDKRKAAVEELVWAVVTSAEFRFNH